MKRSAEFLRGAVAALEAQSRFSPVSMLEHYRSLLADAEARESFPIPDTLPAVPEAREAGEKCMDDLPQVNKRTTGIYHKFNVTRVDGTDRSGGKHDGCAYFVLDLTHDKHAPAAMAAYAESCRKDYPVLADDCASYAASVMIPTTGAPNPTAAEVIAAAEKALGGMVWFLDAGVQESSLAPRCCAVCGKVQIDGQHEHHKSCNSVDIKASLAIIARWKEANGGTTAR